MRGCHKYPGVLSIHNIAVNKMRILGQAIRHRQALCVCAIQHMLSTLSRHPPCHKEPSLHIRQQVPSHLPSQPKATDFAIVCRVLETKHQQLLLPWRSKRVIVRWDPSSALTLSPQSIDGNLRDIERETILEQLS